MTGRPPKISRIDPRGELGTGRAALRDYRCIYPDARRKRGGAAGGRGGCWRERTAQVSRRPTFLEIEKTLCIVHDRHEGGAVECACCRTQNARGTTSSGKAEGDYFILPPPKSYSSLFVLLLRSSSHDTTVLFVRQRKLFVSCMIRTTCDVLRPGPSAYLAARAWCSTIMARDSRTSRAKTSNRPEPLV